MKLKSTSRKVLICLGVTISVASLSLIVGKTVQASSVQMFKRVGSNFCLNAYLPGQGSTVNLWGCDSNDPDQKWEKIPVTTGTTTQLMIKRVGSDFCLNAYRPGKSSKVNLWKCDVNDPDQKWEDIGNQMIKRAGSNFCLNAYRPGKSSTVNLWGCDTKDGDQKWENITPSTTTGNINLPFNSGQTWYVCQGYNGTISHPNRFAFDLTVAKDFGSNNACWAADGNVNKSAGKEVLAPAAGTVRYIGQDLVCLEIDSRRSLLIGHIDRKVSNNQRVSQNALLGIVSKANSKVNGGYAHIHIEPYQSPNCSRGTSVPFTAANGFQFNGIGDLPGPVTNTYWKKELRRP